jgi:hypothetical protein
VPASQLELDSAGLEVTPTASPTVEDLKLQETKLRERRVAIGVGVSLAVVGLVVGLGVGASVGIRRSFD